MRQIIAMIEVDDDRAIAQDIGTLEYLEQEMCWVVDSGIFLLEARILDDDDKHDAKAIELADKIFNEEIE